MTQQEYELQRNALIPEAKRYADRYAGPEPEERGKKKEEWDGKWNKLFHGKMNELARERGLV